MCGRATLAMVVSSEFITVASMMLMVIGQRLASSRWPLMAQPSSAPASAGAAAAPAGLPLGREAGAGRHVGRRLVEGDAHRQAVGPLRPVPRGVLRRQRREGRAG